MGGGALLPRWWRRGCSKQSNSHRGGGGSLLLIPATSWRVREQARHSVTHAAHHFVEESTRSPWCHGYKWMLYLMTASSHYRHSYATPRYWTAEMCNWTRHSRRDSIALALARLFMCFISVVACWLHRLPKVVYKIKCGGAYHVAGEWRASRLALLPPVHTAACHTTFLPCRARLECTHTHARTRTQTKKVSAPFLM